MEQVNITKDILEDDNNLPVAPPTTHDPSSTEGGASAPLPDDDLSPAPPTEKGSANKPPLRKLAKPVRYSAFTPPDLLQHGGGAGVSPIWGKTLVKSVPKVRLRHGPRLFSEHELPFARVPDFNTGRNTSSPLQECRTSIRVGTRAPLCKGAGLQYG